MESDFFKLWDRATEIYPNLRLSIEHSKICDWVIYISFKGSSFNLFQEDNCNRLLLFSKAYFWLHDYLMENNGGY